MPTSETASAKQTSRRTRDWGIETLRGVAVLLMVIGHVVGSSATSGLQVSADSPFRYMFDAVQPIRMPLFTVLSGYVYAMMPLGRSSVRSFVSKKARRLLVPLVVVGLSQFILRAVLPGVNDRPELHNWWTVIVYGTGQFWFLISLFELFLLTVVLERAEMLSTLPRIIAVIAASIGVYAIGAPTNAFSLAGTTQLLPHFFVGIALQRFPAIWLDRRFVAIALVTCIALAFRHLLSLPSLSERWLDPDAAPIDPMWRLALAISSISLLVSFRRVARPLASLGHYSYAVYLFHVLGTAGARIVAKSFGIDTTSELFALSLLAGIVVSIILEGFLARYRWTGTAFLGLSANRPLPT